LGELDVARETVMVVVVVVRTRHKNGKGRGYERTLSKQVMNMRDGAGEVGGDRIYLWSWH
jgi:hypothetical protein